MWVSVPLALSPQVCQYLDSIYPEAGTESEAKHYLTFPCVQGKFRWAPAPFAKQLARVILVDELKAVNCKSMVHPDADHQFVFLQYYFVRFGALHL